MKADHLRELIVWPTLEWFNSQIDKPVRLDDSVVELLVGTVAHETTMGYYLKQIKGPALGIAQVEPKTHDSIWDNYLAYRPDMAEAARALVSERFSSDPPAEEMIGNLPYSIMMARLVYLPVPEPVPDDLEGWAWYWDTKYNKNPYKGTEAEFIQNYRTYAK